MTRQEMIDQLEEIKNELIVGDNNELTDYARKWTYIHVDQAIERLQENREECKNAEDKRQIVQADN